MPNADTTHDVREGSRPAAIGENETGCCGPVVEATCCEPEAKASCCGDATSGTCGCT
jgi:hypothetical protein